MKDEIDAAADRLVAARMEQRVERFGNRPDRDATQELSDAVTDLLVIGIRALDRIATSLERSNEATAMIAALRYNIENL